MTHDSSDDLDADDGTQSTPVWAVFGDLMAGLLGAFVLLLVYALSLHADVSAKLEAAEQQRQQESQRRQALEQVLAGPLASGRVTLVDGRIGISGSVLFASNSADLQPEGRELLQTLSGPLARYLRARGELLMVSGFTDDRPVRGGADNWELSAQRALTVTRALIAEGVAAEDVFAAAFGAQQAVASNDDAEGRARNRRVEMAPMPRPQRAASPAAADPAPQAPAASAHANPPKDSHPLHPSPMSTATPH